MCKSFNKKPGLSEEWRSSDFKNMIFLPIKLERKQACLKTNKQKNPTLHYVSCTLFLNGKRLVPLYLFTYSSKSITNGAVSEKRSHYELQSAHFMVAHLYICVCLMSLTWKVFSLFPIPCSHINTARNFKQKIKKQLSTQLFIEGERKDGRNTDRTPENHSEVHNMNHILTEQ